MNNKKLCVIFDLDGVVFDSREWSLYAPEKKDDRQGWNRFAKHVYVCEPNPAIIDLIRQLSSVLDIIFITGRENSHFLRRATHGQIEKYIGKNVKYRLFMRTYEDYRPAAQIKKEIMDEFVIPYYYPILAYDDEVENVKLFRSYGIPAVYYTKFRKK